MEKRIKELAAVLICFGLGLMGWVSFGAEFEVLDKFSVDGYSEFRGTAAVPSGGFTVGSSTFVVKNGNVGIGTTAPGAKFVVNGNSVVGNPIAIPSNLIGGYMMAQFGKGGIIEGHDNTIGGEIDYGFNIYRADSGYTRVGANGTSRITMGGGSIVMNVGNSGVAGGAVTEITGIAVDSNGNVGIGVTSPGSTLYVNGDIYSSGPGNHTANLALNASGSSPNIQFHRAGYQDWFIGSPSNSADLGIAFGGTSSYALYLQSGGNIGIGTAGPTNKLNLVGGASGASDLATSQSAAAFYVQPKNTSGYGLAFGSGPSDFPYIQNVTIGGGASGNMTLQPYGGNVGIGTTNPTAPLDISVLSGSIITNWTERDVDTGVELDFTRKSDRNQRTLLSIYPAPSTSNEDIILGSTSGMWNSASLQTPGGRVYLNAGGNVGIGTTAPPATLTVVKDLTAGGGDATGFRLQTAIAQTGQVLFGGPSSTGDYAYWQSYKEGTSAGSRPLLLNPIGGNVGIGITAPTDNLDIFDGTASSADARIRSRTTSVSSSFGAVEGSNRFFIYSSGLEIMTHTNHPISFGTNITGGSATPNMVIAASGNIGIGTTNPTAKLYVLGSTYLSDLPTVSGGGSAFSGWGTGNGTWPPNIGSQIPYAINYHTGLAFSAHSAYGGLRFYNQGYPDINTSYLAMQITNNFVTMPGGHGDLAENYRISGAVQRGSMVSVDDSGANTAIASGPSRSSLIGVVSTKPGAVMDVDGGFQIGYTTKPTYVNEKAPLALIGAAPTLVTTQNGPINSGNAIGISSIPGFGAKMITAGNTIGKALERLDTQSACQPVSSVETINWPEDDGKNSKRPCFRLPDGTSVGKIMVAVNSAWYDPVAEIITADSSGNTGIGTTATREKLTVSGDVYAKDAGAGIILKESNGNACRRITVDSLGAISASSAFACP